VEFFSAFFADILDIAFFGRHWYEVSKFFYISFNMTKNQKIHFIFLCVFVLIFLFSCSEHERDNPCDFGGKPDQLACARLAGVEFSLSSSSSVELAGAGSSSSSENIVCEDDEKCGGVCYNRETEFCSIQDTLPHSLCNGSPYNTDTDFCLSGVPDKDDAPTEKCGGYSYDASQDCFNGKIITRCNEVPFGDVVVSATEKCCGIKKYNITTQFCYSSYESIVGDFCGTRKDTYDPSLYVCGTGPGVQANWIYLKDEITRGTEKYKAVLIGTQTWMAENLSYSSYTNSGYYGKCHGQDGRKITGWDNNVPIYESFSESEIEDNCNTYGRLYDWSTALNISSDYNTSAFNFNELSDPSQVQGICPRGWHLPSNEEWDKLMTFVYPACVGTYSDINVNDCWTKLRSVDGWDSLANGVPNGTDDYGFSALPGGWGEPKDCTDDFCFLYRDVGRVGSWWSIDQHNEHYGSTAYIHSMGSETIQDNTHWNDYWNYSYKSALLSVRCLKDD